MKISADFRMIARDALRGKWMVAVLVGLAATLLGGVASSGPEINFHIEGSSLNASLDYAGQTIFSTGGADSGRGLWLHPYKQAANAAFYREISGTGYMGSSEFYSF